MGIIGQYLLAAYSRDGDQVFQAMVITDSSDRDQLRRRTRLTRVCVLEMASWSRLAGWFGDRPGDPWKAPCAARSAPTSDGATRAGGPVSGGATGLKRSWFFLAGLTA
jgi:hypothetical protein